MNIEFIKTLQISINYTFVFLQETKGSSYRSGNPGFKLPKYFTHRQPQS